jgi:hypothetical protein
MTLAQYDEAHFSEFHPSRKGEIGTNLLVARIIAKS